MTDFESKEIADGLTVQLIKVRCHLAAFDLATSLPGHAPEVSRQVPNCFESSRRQRNFIDSPWQMQFFAFN